MIKSWLVANESLDTERLQTSPLAEDPTQSIAARLLEHQAENQETDALLRDVGQMSYDMQQLEIIEKHINESETISDATTRTVDVAIESFCKRWDIDLIKPGVEARAHNVNFLRKQVALEGIGSAIASGIAKFIAWLKELLVKLKNKINIFSKVAKSIEERAALVKKYIDSGKYSTKPNAFITKETLNGLELDGVVNVKGVLGFVHKLRDDVKSDLNAISSQFNNWKPGVKGDTEIKVGVVRKKGGDYRALPGGMYFHLSVDEDSISKEGTTTIHLLRELSDKPIKLPMLDKQDIDTIIDNIDVLCNTIPKALSAMEPAIESVKNMHERLDDSDEDKAIVRHMRSAGLCLSTYVDAVTNVSTKTARALLEYAEESVKLSKA